MRRKIGLVGGVSPESTVEYYKYIMRTYVERSGDLDLPEVIIYSVRFKRLWDWSTSGRWDLMAEELIRVGRKLEAAGAECLLLTANTLHKVIEDFAAGVDAPVISILDVVAEAIKARGFTTVGLLGTLYTMELPFYREALSKRGIAVITPEAAERQAISDIIYNELTRGILLEESRRTYLTVVDSLAARGAQGVILGCTEIPLLLSQADTELPLFNTTELHAEAALQFALGE